MLAAQNKCKHCVYWDTQMAKLFGASEQEITEAIEMGNITKHWSTWLNGNLFKEKDFRKEVKKIMAYLKKQSNKKN